ncbi:ribosome small subunit-dependent GTPase A [Lysinibacillus sp. 54212]|uniref:ribosome small subunit-dependent GTPase A n=1 Tax=Lysinibacillus sp. 54212 TaxID=3119829 RepID=UPI002FC99B9B
MNLINLGFSEFFKEQIVDEKKDYSAARVVLEHKHSYRVAGEQGEWLATVSGNFSYSATGRFDYPAIGDWVIVEKMPGEQKAIIHKLLKRKSAFVRKVAGLEIQQQIVAANVDIVFLVMSMNQDFNIRRLERYLTAAWDSGAKPIIVLTKADLCEDRTFYRNEIERNAPGVDYFVTSTVTGEGIEALQMMLKEGKTGALLGSSGVGKSSITNALTMERKMEISEIREDDAKGRHTTTHRELVLLPSGGCLIDTPGMRELQLWDQGENIGASFRDIERLAEHCRFRDCTHQNEPHCAVQRAISDGTLELARLLNYFKLGKEAAFLERKLKAQSKLEEKRKQKKVSKGIKRKGK